MAKYRKKPVVIDAFLWTAGSDQKEDPEWVIDAINEGEIELVSSRNEYVQMRIVTLEGIMIANRGDYIIQGVNGEIYPCKAEIFEKTYELVGDER